MDTKRTTKALMILAHYDSKAQMVKCCEELSELNVAILKYVNGLGSSDAVLDEIADVYIMLEQLKAIMPFGMNIIDEMIDYKLDRQLKRIRGESEESSDEQKVQGV